MIDVSLDGSWHRKGYASLNGFVSCLEREHNEVVDTDVMTKDCRSCWAGSTGRGSKKIQDMKTGQ